MAQDEQARTVEFRLLPALPAVNASQASGSDAAQTYTITPGAGERVVLYRVGAYCSAGTSTFSIESPSGTVVYQGAAGAIATTEVAYEPNTPQTFGMAKAVLLKLTTAGSSNTTRLNVQAGILQ